MLLHLTFNINSLVACTEYAPEVDFPLYCHFIVTAQKIYTFPIIFDRESISGCTVPCLTFFWTDRHAHVTHVVYVQIQEGMWDDGRPLAKWKPAGCC